jgi:hypothetical protein
MRQRTGLLASPGPSHQLDSVARVWSAHTLVLVTAIGGALMCIGLLAWLVFRKSEPQAPFGL